MTPSQELQKMIFDRLVAHAGVAAIVAGRVYDKPAPDAQAPYISFGPSDTVPDDPDGLVLRRETVQIDCWSEAQDGRREIKGLVDEVKAALHRFDGSLVLHALCSIEVTGTRVLADPDGITLHGIVTVEAEIEDR